MGCRGFYEETKKARELLTKKPKSGQNPVRCGNSRIGGTFGTNRRRGGPRSLGSGEEDDDSKKGKCSSRLLAGPGTYA